MPTGYIYELYKAGKIIGTYWSSNKLVGKFLVVPELHTLKERYSTRPKMIEVPLVSHVVYDDGVEYRVRMRLDVSKKSKRQIDILQGYTET